MSSANLKDQNHPTHFLHWHARATVRTSDRARVMWTGQGAKLYFPPEKVLVLSHTALASLSDSNRTYLQVQRLYSYLQFTAKLERYAINPVALDIADGKHGLSLSSIIRRDADKIYTDEAWHAQFSNELLDQVQEETGIAASLENEPMFLTRVRQLKAQHPEHTAMIDLFFAIVSETLISALLTDIPSDERLVTSVRRDVADHAKDEAVHNAFFSDLLRVVWPQLSERTRTFIGPQICSFIIWFLEPTPEIYVEPLQRLGYSPGEAEQIASDSIDSPKLRADSRMAAEKILRLLMEVGAFRDVETKEAFQKARFLSK